MASSVGSARRRTASSGDQARSVAASVRPLRPTHRISRLAGVAFVPWMVATVLAVHPAREIAFQAYSGVTVGGILALMALGVLAWGWSRLLDRNSSTKPVAP